MPNEIRCPACGSDSIDESTASRSFPLPYGPRFSVNEIVDTCRRCGESGDFANRNEELISEKKAEATKASIVGMLAALADSEITMAYIERALSLPARTLARWKEGQFSASGTALLRLVRTYPWLLDVADAGFDQRYANVALVQASAAVIAQFIPATSLTRVTTSAHAPNAMIGENNFMLTKTNISPLSFASPQPSGVANFTATPVALVSR